MVSSCQLAVAQFFTSQNSMSELNVIGPGRVIVGKRCRIAPDVQFIFQREATVRIGDYCIIGSGVKFVCDGGDVDIGDWTSIHDRCLVLSTEGLDIGQHCWFGQQCVIDGSAQMTIGNGVRVGMYSQLWSHVAAGEQLEGCTLFGTRAVTIEDDVWLVGTCSVASGVTIGRRTVALNGSNITKSCAANSVLAGSPAVPKEKLNFYQNLSIDQKWQMLRGWVSEIAGQNAMNLVQDTADILALECQSAGANEYLCFARNAAASGDQLADFPGATVCDLATKTYNKTYSDIEAVVLKSLAGNKARFYTKV
jgi:acetyltransferase-like isoleucine patch superfamily enzyme